MNSIVQTGFSLSAGLCALPPATASEKQKACEYKSFDDYTSSPTQAHIRSKDGNSQRNPTTLDQASETAL
jgi:hypothetical protein